MKINFNTLGRAHKDSLDGMEGRREGREGKAFEMWLTYL